MARSLNRRLFLAGAAASAAAIPGAASAQSVTLPFDHGERPLVAYPQKRPLIVLTPRPPQLETPLSVFDETMLTPNDAFFVRWHLANIPTRIDPATFRTRVFGLVDRELSLSPDDLRGFEPVEIVAVNQCSGNGRGLSSPRVAGGQWTNGAMGNARWKGARLKDILARAGLKAGVKQIRFNGADGPVLPGTPDFIKALDVDVATGADILVAYEMNGAPLPVLNGFPVRLVVPGWYSTYWVKMLDSIEAIATVDDNFWMKTAYRIPDTPRNAVIPGSTGFPTIPINRMRVRSLITTVADGGTIPAGAQTIRGIAFDGGSGIARVEVSTDGGHFWTDALLGGDHGRYSFRRFEFPLTLARGATATLMSRATAADGSVQPMQQGWNPSGYLRDVVETVRVTGA